MLEKTERRGISGRRGLIVAFALAAVLLVGSVSAYFTATDAAVNEWTVGHVAIELTEPEYDYEAENLDFITPNQELAKDPQVTNVGSADTFVFMKVSIPKANVRVADEDGTIQPSAMQELFSYEIDEDWELVSSNSGTDANHYIYAYANDGSCIALTPEATTSPLFEDGVITLKNLADNEYADNTLDLPVYTYGIQADNLTEDNVYSAEDVWYILSNQMELDK